MAMATKPIRVFLVDDSVPLLWGLGKLVQGEFPRMTLIGTARSGSQALTQAWLRPDVIVLDLDLDGDSSIETIPALKQRSGGNVLVHTGLGDRRLHEDAVLFGAHGVLAKDVAAALLLDSIERVHAGGYVGLDPSVVASGRPVPAGALASLSEDERRLFVELAQGWERRAAAIVRPPVVLKRLVSLYDRLDLGNRAELAQLAAALVPAAVEE